MIVLIIQVCVTLYDWRTFPEQFAKSWDPDEQNLYVFLTEEAGPQVLEALIVSRIAAVAGACETQN